MFLYHTCHFQNAIFEMSFIEFRSHGFVKMKLTSFIEFSSHFRIDFAYKPYTDITMIGIYI